MLKIVFLTTLLFTVCTHTMVAQKYLDVFLWKSRVLVVSDKRATHPEQVKQFMAFYKKEEENKDRQLVLLTLTKNQTFLGLTAISEPPQNLLKEMQLEPTFTGVLLLGKDGGIKLKSIAFTSTEEIYAFIDGMPMRKQELRLKKTTNPPKKP